MPLSSPRLTNSGNCGKSLCGTRRPGDTRGIIAWAGQDKIVEHDLAPMRGISLGDKGLFRRTGMDENRVDIAGRPEAQRLAGSHDQDPDLDSEVSRDRRQQGVGEDRIFK